MKKKKKKERQIFIDENMFKERTRERRREIMKTKQEIY